MSKTISRRKRNISDNTADQTLVAPVSGAKNIGSSVKVGSEPTVAGGEHIVRCEADALALLGD
jgi:hypothetical protein